MAAFVLAGAALAQGAAKVPSTTQPTPAVSALAMEQEDAGSQRSTEREAVASAEAPPTLRWTTGAELSGRTYRWSASRGAFDFGMSFDALPRAAGPFDLHPETAAPTIATLPSLSLGLSRTASGAAVPAGTLLERALNPASGAAYVSKVGIEWKPAESQVNFVREGLGIRLDGNDRMTVRMRKGVVGLYMQRNF